VDIQGYWFEEVPEEHRYWFLVPWGPSPREEAEIEESVFSTDQHTELRGMEAEVRSETVFGTTGPEARKRRRRIEGIRARMDAVGYGASALDVPWWPLVPKWEHREATEYVQAPMLFTTQEAAQEQKRQLEGTEADAYLALREEEGEAVVDEAFSNTSPLRAMWTDSNALLDKLEDSDFLCVMVNHRLKLREDFIEELKRRLEEQER
jgi:hypothetical protein